MYLNHLDSSAPQLKFGCIFSLRNGTVYLLLGLSFLSVLLKNGSTRLLLTKLLFDLRYVLAPLYVIL
jgi:hypothetical protein